MAPTLTSTTSRSGDSNPFVVYARTGSPARGVSAGNAAARDGGVLVLVVPSPPGVDLPEYQR